jgi:hypothetical protein
MADLLNFNDKTHPLSEQSSALFDKLVPAVGKCDTLQGELLRASSKISYDWYNNGWGCNNWSGAVIYLQRHLQVLPVQPSPAERQQLAKSLARVYNFSHGERVRGSISDSSVMKHITKIHEIVVAAILANPEPVDNPIDMWDLSERY